MALGCSCKTHCIKPSPAQNCCTSGKDCEWEGYQTNIHKVNICGRPGLIKAAQKSWVFFILICRFQFHLKEYFTAFTKRNLALTVSLLPWSKTSQTDFGLPSHYASVSHISSTETRSQSHSWITAEATRTLQKLTMEEKMREHTRKWPNKNQPWKVL